MMTYRYSGHSMSDPGTTYRTREEIQQTRDEKDPINNLQKRLLEAGYATEDELKVGKFDEIFMTDPHMC
jgi:pyruvate dehydrogenase E1 component alpha subunit